MFKKINRSLQVVGLATSVLLVGCVNQVNGPKPPEPKPKKAAKTHFDLGVAYMQKGRYDLAEPKLQRSIAANPTPEAYNALALLYETLHNNALAEETYQHLVSSFPDYALGYLNYNIFLCKYDRFSQIEQLAASMAGRGKDVAAIGQIAAGNCALSKENTDAAVMHYQAALKYEEYAAGALLPLAQIDLQRGFAAEAREKINRVHNHIGYSSRSVYLAVLANRELGDAMEERKMMNVLRTRYGDSPEASELLR